MSNHYAGAGFVRDIDLLHNYDVIYVPVISINLLSLLKSI
jgi:hypothetical protein